MEEKIRKKGLIKNIIIGVLICALIGAALDNADKSKKEPEAKELKQETRIVEQKQEEIDKLNKILEEKENKIEELEEEIRKLKKEKKEPKEEVEVKEGMSSDTKMDIFIAGLKESYKDLAKIEVDEEKQIIKILPEGNFKTSMLALVATKGNKPELREAWGELVTAIQTLSKTLGEINPEYSIAIINPVNDEKSFLTAYCGVLTYNVLDEFN